jgi:hypothetical protein
VPVSATLCWPPAALSVIVSVPVIVPVPFGANCTGMVQLLPTGIVLDSGLHIPALIPLPSAKPVVTPKLVNVMAVFPVLVTVTICAALMVPTVCGPNVKLEGERLIVPVPDVPVPVRAAVSGLPPVTLSVTVSAPVIGPTVAGLNATSNVQLAAGAKVAVGVHVPPDAISKFAAIEKPVRPTDTVPLFVIVTACAALVVPSA